MLKVCMALMLFSVAVKAQTWSEWVSQKKTQRKYLLEQLAALKLYSGYLKKGYDIGRSGLSFIKDATHGEFSLHADFFESLKTVSPQIKKYPKVAEIMMMQVSIGKVLSALKDVEQLSADNRRYLENVREGILENCINDLEELLLVVTSGRLEMQEDQRIDRIDHLYESMLEKWNFTSSFFHQVQSLNLQKGQEIKNLSKIGGLYGN